MRACHLAVLAALAAACGDETTIVNNAAAAASSADTAQASTGAGGSDGDGGAATATTGGPAATTSAETSSASGGTGGSGGAGDAGGPPAVDCPAATCDAVDINCDPACGAVHPACAQACVAGGFADVGFGVTFVRTPPVLEQHGGCAEVCGDGDSTLWGLLLRLPSEPFCLGVVGPEGGLIGRRAVASGGDVPAVCRVAGDSRCVEIVTDEAGQDSYVMVGVHADQPTNGSLYSLVVEMGDDCPTLNGGECGDVGCNGSGG
jgi:hypothetical protein